jgi:formylglycine-generating enzyme
MSVASSIRYCWAVLLFGIASVQTAICVFATPISIDMVTVGNPGNSPDAAIMTDSTTGYGAVGYTFQIAKYETTVDQYVAFLNSNAQSDAYSLYDGGMSLVISRVGSDGTYQYASRAFMGNKPIAWVDWLKAARFANWMNNGQVSGSTETGAYTLNGTFSATGIQRNVNAKVWLPSENEWYKAAYYSGTGSNYWLYPTQTNQVPDKVTADAAGVGSAGPLGNFANYGRSANIFTMVGTNGGPSAYGAFDLGGNLQEWNETEIITQNGPQTFYSRGIRGSDYVNSAAYLISTERQGYMSPSFEDGNLGFRVAAVPNTSAVPEIDPNSMGSVIALVTGALGLLERRRLKAKMP